METFPPPLYHCSATQVLSNGINSGKEKNKFQVVSTQVRVPPRAARQGSGGAGLGANLNLNLGNERGNFEHGFCAGAAVAVISASVSSAAAVPHSSYRA